MRIATVVALVVLATGAGHAQTGPTFRQLAVSTKGKTEVMSIACGWAGPPLASIVGFADLAVEAIIVSIRTYPTADDRDIYTEYEVATRQVILQRTDRARVQVNSTPSMFFKTRGGTVVFDGYPLTLDVQSDNRRAQLNPGDHVILFGRYDSSDATWVFGPRDFFQVSDDVVINWLPTLEDTPPEGLEPRMALTAFASKVRSLSRNP